MRSAVGQAYRLSVLREFFPQFPPPAQNAVFFFKQKTAYEIVSGDWSSDVCSSDLMIRRPPGAGAGPAAGGREPGGGGRLPRRARVRPPPRSEERRVGKECLTQC